MASLFDFDIDGALLAGIDVARGRKTWSGHDRSKTVGASEVGRCLRATWYGKSKVPYDETYLPTIGAMERGNAIEDWVVLKVKDAIKHDPRFGEWTLLYSGTDQVTMVDEPQSATPDGLLVHNNNGKCIYLEIKSLDPRIYETMTDAKTEHKCQAIQGMGLFHRTTQYKPDKAILLYVNSSFVDHYRTFGMLYNADGDKALRKRAAAALDKVGFTLDRPPPAEGMAEGGKECEYCPFRVRCTLREAGRLPTNERKIPEAAERELHELVLTRQELRIRENESEASRKSTEQEIVALLEKHETKRVQAPWGGVSIYKAHSPPVVLWEELEKAVGNTDKFKRAGTPYIRINVSLK